MNNHDRGVHFFLKEWNLSNTFWDKVWLLTNPYSNTFLWNLFKGSKKLSQLLKQDEDWRDDEGWIVKHVSF